MEEAEMNDDDLTMDFESGIDTWVIDKDDTNTSVINVEQSLGVEITDSVIMNKENINSGDHTALHYIKISNLNSKDASSQINENLKRKIQTDTGYEQSFKKHKFGFGCLDMTFNDKEVLKQNLKHSSTYINKNKIKGSLSSEEISSLLSEDSLESTPEKNRGRLHSIENVTDLVDKLKGNEQEPFQIEDGHLSVDFSPKQSDILLNSTKQFVQECATNILQTPVPNDNKTDYLDMYKNHLLIHNSVKSKNLKQRKIRKVQNGQVIKNETLKCNLCIYCTSDCLVFETHKLLYHSTSTDLFCKDCDYRTSQVANLITHIKKHYEYVDCPHCTFKGWFKQGMKGHFKNAHPDTKRYKCKSCNYSCKTEKKYYKHLRLHTKFQCADCSLYFTSKQILEKHVKAHLKSSKYKCGECDSTFSNKFDLKFHNKTSHLNSYTCDTCSSQFTHKHFLKLHMKTHTIVEKQKLKCNKCDSLFERKNHLTLHLRFNHLSESLKCQYCPFQCNDSNDFTNHICNNELCNDQKQLVEEEMVEINLKKNNYKAQTDHKQTEAAQDISLINEPELIENKNTKNVVRGRYNKKIYKLNRKKVLSLRHNLPSRSQVQPVGLPDDNLISTNTNKLQIPNKQKFKLLSKKQRINKARVIIRNNGSYKTNFKQNSVQVMGSKIHKVGRGRPRKIKIQKKMSVPYSCEEMFFTEKSSAKVDLIKLDRLRNENYVECFYQSHDSTFLNCHIERHIRQNKLLSCRFCRYKTNSEQLLQRHIAKYHTWNPALVNDLFKL